MHHVSLNAVHLMWAIFHFLVVIVFNILFCHLHLCSHLKESSVIFAEVPENYRAFVDFIDGYSYYYPSDWRVCDKFDIETNYNLCYICQTDVQNTSHVRKFLTCIS